MEILGFDREEITSLLIEAVIHGILWGLTFYYIRKRLNKRNFRENPKEKRLNFYWDGLYGGFAAFCMVIAKKVILTWIKEGM